MLQTKLTFFKIAIIITIFQHFLIIQTIILLINNVLKIRMEMKIVMVLQVLAPKDKIVPLLRAKILHCAQILYYIVKILTIYPIVHLVCNQHHSLYINLKNTQIFIILLESPRFNPYHAIQVLKAANIACFTTPCTIREPKDSSCLP